MQNTTLITLRFRPIRASIMVFLYQLGIAFLIVMFLYLLSSLLSLPSASIFLISGFVSIPLGSALYAGRYEKKKPGRLEPFIKAVSVGVLVINFLWVSLKSLPYLLESLTAGKLTGSDYIFMLGIFSLFALPTALIIYFGTKQGLKMGIKQSQKVAAKKVKIPN